MTNRPTALCIGDLHATNKQPKCRVDDFQATQKDKFSWLRSLWAAKLQPLVLQPGDLFDRWDSPPEVINMVLDLLPPMHTLPGNPGKHNHGLISDPELIKRDAIYTVALAKLGWVVAGVNDALMSEYLTPGIIIHVYACPWGEEPYAPRKIKSDVTTRNVLITHHLLTPGPAAYGADNALEYLKKHQGYDLILTGHNHEQFVVEHKGRYLVNPGSFTRQTAAETHEPKVYTWYAESNTIEAIPVPINPTAVSRQHIPGGTGKENNPALDAFIELLDSKPEDPEGDIVFKEVVATFIKQHGRELKAGIVERLAQAAQLG